MTFEEWSNGKRKKKTNEKQSFEEWSRERYSAKPTVSTKKDDDIAPVRKITGNPVVDTIGVVGDIVGSKKGTIGNVMKAVSPIAAVASTASEVKKGGYFNKGVFEDGYQKR